MLQISLKAEGVGFEGGRLFFLIVMSMLAWSTMTFAQEATKQVALSEKDVLGFVNAQTDLKSANETYERAEGEPPAAVDAVYDKIAKKYGFDNLEDLNLVGANIAIVLLGLDPETGEYISLRDDIKSEISEVRSNNGIDEAEKKRLIAELEKELAATQPIKHPENISIVKKHRDKIEKALK